MSFFLKKKQPSLADKMGSRGRKRKVGGGGGGSGPKTTKGASSAPSSRSAARAAGGEEIPSDDSDVEGRPDAGYESEEDAETAEQKRLRLAKKYLEEIEREERDRAGAAASAAGSASLDGGGDDQVHAAVNQRLKDADLEDRGRLRLEVAKRYEHEGVVNPEHFRVYRHKTHSLSITCLVVSPDGRFAFSASKDGGLVKWAVDDGTKMAKIGACRKKGGEAARPHAGHCSSVNALAISSDGAFLASGDASKLIHVWDADSMELLKTFTGHRDAVSGLAFRRNSHTLYSCSYDRSVKIWSVDDRAYVETLFGHQDRITGIDAGLRERCITTGGRDGSVRVWKIVEESQLVFNGPATSTDGVVLTNEEHFVTGGEDGHLSLWSVNKKKPLFTVKCAHGVDAHNGEPHWIGALAALHNTDLVASGSRDGFIRLWRCADGFRRLLPVRAVPVEGFINALAFTPDGAALVAGVGQEHRLGRWWRIKEAKNSVVIIPFNFGDSNA